jgi:hypothetical protein
MAARLRVDVAKAEAKIGTLLERVTRRDDTIRLLQTQQTKMTPRRHGPPAALAAAGVGPVVVATDGRQVGEPGSAGAGPFRRLHAAVDHRRAMRAPGGLGCCVPQAVASPFAVARQPRAAALDEVS